MSTNAQFPCSVIIIKPLNDKWTPFLLHLNVQLQNWNDHKYIFYIPEHVYIEIIYISLKPELCSM